MRDIWRGWAWEIGLFYYVCSVKSGCDQGWNCSCFVLFQLSCSTVMFFMSVNIASFFRALSKYVMVPTRIAASRHQSHYKLPYPEGSDPAAPRSPTPPADTTAPEARRTARHPPVMVPPAAFVQGSTACGPAVVVTALGWSLAALVTPEALRVAALVRLVTSVTVSVTWSVVSHVGCHCKVITLFLLRSFHDTLNRVFLNKYKSKCTD